MTDSTSTPVPTDGDRGIAPGVTQILAPTTPLETPLQAVARIHAVCDIMRTLSVVAQLQIMEACWVIRNHYADREAFERFLGDQGVNTVLAMDDAWTMALTYDAQRRNRALRELTGQHPTEAMRLISGFLAAGKGEQIDVLDDRDREVVKLISGPPRSLRSKIRDLLAMEATQREGAGRDPHDVARIDALEAQIADRSPVTPLTQHPAAHWQHALVGLQKTESSLQAIADEMFELADSAAPSAQIRARVAALTDMAMGTLERIAGLALEP